MVGVHVLDAVERRLDGAPSASYLQLGGHRLGDPEPEVGDTLRSLALERSLWEQQAERDPQGLTVTARDLLLGSAFHLAADRQDTGFGPRLSTWAQVSTGHFDGHEDDVSLDGRVTTATLGADAAWRRWLTGVALAYSEGDGSYRGPSDEGRLDSALTSLHPYVSYALSDRARVWGVAGYGSGSLHLVRAAETLQTDLRLTMGALGVRGTVLSQPKGLILVVRSDVLWVRTASDAVAGALAATQADTNRVRLALEGSRPVALRSGELTPVLKVGVRRDGGDAETGSGVELGARLGYDSGCGLSADVSVRGLVAHESSSYREWGAGGLLLFDPGERGVGLSATVSPSWGTSASGVDQLWSRPDTRGLASGSVVATETPVLWRRSWATVWVALRGRGLSDAVCPAIAGGRFGAGRGGWRRACRCASPLA